MPFYYDLTSVNIFCHLVVRMSSPFIIAVIHQCVCVSSFHDSSSFMVVSPTSKFLNICRCWEGGFPCSPTSESEGMWLPNTSPKSFIICHDLSRVFISFHHSPSLLICSIILYHLASSCMTLYHAYHILSSGFIHLLPDYIWYPVYRAIHLSSPIPH